MTDQPCSGCREPRDRDGAALCGSCTRRLRTAVRTLADLLPEVAVSAARLDRVATVPHRHPAGLEPLHVAEARAVKDLRALVPHPLPVNLDAADLHREARAVIREWIRVLLWHPPMRWHTLLDPVEGRWVPHAVCGHRKCETARHEADPDQRALRLLLTHLPDLRRRDDAGRALRSLAALARRCTQLVDRQVPEVYAGPCDAPDVKTWHDPEAGVVGIAVDAQCGVDLYANLGDSEVTCEACGAVYVLADRKVYLREAVRNVWARPALIASALTSMDFEVTAAKLDNWIWRDRLQFEAGRPRRVAYPPILPVSWTLLDPEGDPILEPVLDSDGLEVWEPVKGADGRPVRMPVLDADGVQVVGDDGELVWEPLLRVKLRPAGKPLFRVGDVMDRVDALREAAKAKETA